MQPANKRPQTPCDHRQSRHDGVEPSPDNRRATETASILYPSRFLFRHLNLIQKSFQRHTRLCSTKVALPLRDRKAELGLPETREGSAAAASPIGRQSSACSLRSGNKFFFKLTRFSVDDFGLAAFVRLGTSDRCDNAATTLSSRPRTMLRISSGTEG